MKINHVNVQSIIQFQSGQYSRAEVVESFNMFDNKPEEIEKWIDDLLLTWLVEERGGKLYWLTAQERGEVEDYFN